MEIDLESHLRKLDPDKPHEIHLWIGAEGRLMMEVAGVDFTVFGQNTMHKPPAPPEPEKPPTQVFKAEGFSSSAVSDI